ncbi:MAG: PIG-L deacetylase family protein [Acidimicrobiia bacterium]
MIRPGRALAIGAHPDDIEFGCGGTLAKWARSGTVVHLLVLTDGSKGSWDAGADLADLVATRQSEQRDAARALGAVDVHFLGPVDGELVANEVQRAEVCRIIRRVRPDAVLGHDPWKRYRLHPDHREAGLLTVESIVAARDPHFFPDQVEAPHRPEWLLLFEPDEIDHLESLGPLDLQAKLDALRCHRSQWHSTMGIDDGPASAAQRRAFEVKVTTELEQAGAAISTPAEPFKLITDL